MYFFQYKFVGHITFWKVVFQHVRHRLVDIMRDAGGWHGIMRDAGGWHGAKSSFSSKLKPKIAFCVQHENL